MFADLLGYSLSGYWTSHKRVRRIAKRFKHLIFLLPDFIEYQELFLVFTTSPSFAETKLPFPISGEGRCVLGCIGVRYSLPFPRHLSILNYIMKKVSHILLQTLDIYAQELLSHVREKQLGHPEQATILLIQGDLGAGKTTLTQSMGRVLDIADHIVSPTYVISRRYHAQNTAYPWKNLIHTDAYRLEHADDLKKLAYDVDCQNPDNVMIFEWPERVGNYFDDYETTRIRIEMGEEQEERVVTLIGE